MRSERLDVTSEEVLADLAARLVAKELTAGTQLALCGPLGAGKTTFVRYLCRALNVQERVTSPSFVLEHRYDVPAGIIDGVTAVSHWDIYRLREAPEDLLAPVPRDEIRLVEWADKDPEIVARSSLELRFTVEGDIEDSDPASLRRAVEIVRRI